MLTKEGHSGSAELEYKPCCLVPGFSFLEESLPFLGYSAFYLHGLSPPDVSHQIGMKTGKTQLCLLCEVKTTYQNKHSLVLFNFSFYIAYFLGNEKNRRKLLCLYKYFITKAKHFTIGINEPKTVHRTVLFCFPELFGSFKVLGRK